MPNFTYTDQEARYYPTLSLFVEPGDVHEFDEAPDGFWAPADAPSSPPADPPADPTDAPAPAPTD